MSLANREYSVMNGFAPDDDSDRLNAEWVTLNAVREMRRLATQGAESSYRLALELGDEVVPALLGRDVSLIAKAQESDLVKEYKQRAAAKTVLIVDAPSSAVVLLETDIDELKHLLSAATDEGKDRLKARLRNLQKALGEIRPTEGSEHTMIFRDAYRVSRKVPVIGEGQSTRDLELPDGNVLRVRVCHPDRPEHVTGADLIYERHHPSRDEANVVVVQYKIWDKKDRTLYLADPRLQKQLEKLKQFTCGQGLCSSPAGEQSYRFPFCAAFLRPTDKLQSPNQALSTTGEHLPVCAIEKCSNDTRSQKNPTKKLLYSDMRDVSLSHHVFEGLFSYGKIGSRAITYPELEVLYRNFEVEGEADRIVIHAQEFADPK